MFDADSESFLLARRDYFEARKQQREKIRNLLATRFNCGVKRGPTAGQGIQNYTAARTIPVYDLSGWMWVEGVLPGSEWVVLVTLQVLDRDPKSRNVHALFDRVGVLVARAGRNGAEVPHAKLSQCGAEHFNEQLADAWVLQEVLRIHDATDIDLPLTKKKLDRLAQIIQARIDAATDA